jgi:hypothetical protein
VGTTAVATKILPFKCFPITDVCNNCLNIQCNLLKWKTSRKSQFWISELFHVTCNWYDSHLWQKVPHSWSQTGTTETISYSKALIRNPSAGVVGLLFHAKLISSLASPGHNKQQLLHWRISVTVKKGWQQIKTHTLHYDSIISVLKKKVANPSKHKSLLPLDTVPLVKSLYN